MFIPVSIFARSRRICPLHSSGHPPDPDPCVVHQFTPVDHSTDIGHQVPQNHELFIRKVNRHPSNKEPVPIEVQLHVAIFRIRSRPRVRGSTGKQRLISDISINSRLSIKDISKIIPAYQVQQANQACRRPTNRRTPPGRIFERPGDCCAPDRLLSGSPMQSLTQSLITVRAQHGTLGRPCRQRKFHPGTHAAIRLQSMTVVPR